MKAGLELFSGGVRGALVQHCGKCHTGEDVEGEFDLTTREGLLKGGTAGAAVIPGNAKDSLLYRLIAHEKKPFMPQEAEKLPDELIAKIGRWIELGAPYEKPLVESSGPPAWTRREVAPAAKTWWAFQPLKKVDPPAVPNAAGAATPIDLFLRAKLEAAGIGPNPAVDRRTLVRRAYFDLIGLPPTAAEVEAFVNDADPNAYGRLLDRLLDSPQYGERWARHWLDLVRFAESHGFEHDYDRPTAYHYRDFVIQALNRDLPYDTFVKWQIAGDEYEPENNLALMATGFLAAGVHSTQITKNEVEKHRYDEMDDMLATTGTAMLGLTIGCARCHDHKFDPFPTADYYRLLSTFTTTVRSEVDLEFDHDRYVAAKAEFDKTHQPFEQAVAKHETDKLPAAFAAWVAGRPAQSEPGWIVLEPSRSVSKGGATLSPQGDGSILATGKNEKFDTYEFTIQTTLTGLTGLRLEALSDPSMVKGGPGRAANGNFALSDVKVTVADKDGKNPQPVKLRAPRATFEQKGLPVAATIDGDPKSSWAVDPEFGKTHAAAYEFETPVGMEGGAVLTLTLSFNGNDGHNFGRTRLSTTTSSKPLDLKADGLPHPVLEALAVAKEQRSPDQAARLLKWYRHRDAEWLKLRAAADEHLKGEPKPNVRKVLIATEGLPAVRLHTQGGDFLDATHFLRRGDTANKDAVAAQGFLQVLMRSPDREKHWPAAPPAGWRTSYRRRALAEWLTDVESGAGSLLARVIVNRLWQQHFGRGIVATPSDYGTRGSPPSQPELLDFLALELIRNGWKLKPIHKLMLQSAAWQQSSHVDEAKARVDPDNALVWRRPRRRLEAEILRDSMLALSGTLDPAMFGPGTLDPTSHRRAIYFTIKRSQLIPMMQVFDCPDALSGIAERPVTTTALQSLLLINNPLVRESAHAFARKIAGDPDPIDRAFREALSRSPTAFERNAVGEFLKSQAATYAGKPDAALTDVCHLMFCLNEFSYVE